MKNGTSKGNVFLHLVLLVGLAIAQPLYDLVGANPEFLVAHRLEPRHVLGYVTVLSLGIPLLLFLIYQIMGVISHAAGRFFLGIIITLFTALFVLPIATRWFELDGFLTILMAFLAGGTFAMFYFRNAGTRMFLSWFSIAALLFPLNFLFLSTASELLKKDGEPSRYKDLTLTRTPPIIMVVFDEFPLLSILNSDLEIDRGRFPHFAELATRATWYRYHTTNSDSTLVSIPNLLSGNLPFGRDRGLPSHADYPNNLMALLQNQYKVSATEHGTRLCPDTVCARQPAYLKLLFTDSLVILGQIWSPPSLAQHLPSTNNDWLGFLGEEVLMTKELTTIRAFQKTINWRTRVVQYQQFIDGITAEEKRLYYFHSMFPHGSWRYLPDGRLMTADAGGQIVGIRPNDPALNYKHVWYASDAATRVSRQRHVLQVGFVDRMIGDLVTRLEELGIFDQSLIIITSDHGVSFKAGFSRRSIHGDNLAEIAAVPLFIKYPGNQPNGISDLNAQAMDILPSILDALGAQGWDQFDGQSLLNTNRDEQIQKIIFSEKRRTDRINFEAYKSKLRQTAQTLTLEFGQNDYSSLFRAGDRLGLVGTRVSDYLLSDQQAPGVSYEYSDLLRNAHRDGSFTQCVVHGNFNSGYEHNPSQQLAISVNGVIQAVTEPFSFPGQKNAFQALVPADSFAAEVSEVRTWFVLESSDGLVLLEAPGEEMHSYVLSKQANAGWSIQLDDKEILVERGEVPGWVNVIPEQSPNTFLVGGWAADLAAQEPADKILVFINGKFYYALSPDRNSERTAADFQMHGILRSGFRFPVSVPEGQDPLDTEVRIFALSRAGEISELNYPKTPDRWVFRQNPRPEGPAIKPYR